MKIKFTFIVILLIGVCKINAQTPPIIYIGTNGSGDYNCEGENCQIEINQALDFVAENSDYTTVYLKGENTYWINEPIYISSNSILEGDSNSIIKLVDNADWNTRFKSLIMQKGATFTIGLEDTTNLTNNITIRGFEIDGNRKNQEEPSGNSHYNMIKLQNCYNITINNMYLHDNLSDLLNIHSTFYGNDINLKFFNNRVHGSGHDGIYVGQSTNFEIYNNNFTNNRTDAHIRAQDCNHFKIYNNICGNDPDNRNSGGIGIDIQVKGNTPLNDVEIYGNYIYGKGAFHGIWLWQTNAGGELNTHRDVYIHHNIISGNQASGIGIFGFNNTIIENNVIDFNGEGNNRSYTDNVLFGNQAGITFYKGGNKNKIKGFKTIVQNNIIVNNATYGIENKKPKLHTFISNYNCIYNNDKGNYKNVFSTTDIYVDPNFASDNTVEINGRLSYTYKILNAHWQKAILTGDFSGNMGANEAYLVYHLRSEEGRWNGVQWEYDDVTSFCINTGNSISDFSNEQSPNGNVINIGAFGNTFFASKSDKIPDVHNFIAYPNPTSGIITISEEFVNSEYIIYSIQGEILKKGVLISNKIDLTNFFKGIYLIKIREYNSLNWRTGRIIKMN